MLSWSQGRTRRQPEPVLRVLASRSSKVASAHVLEIHETGRLCGTKKVLKRRRARRRRPASGLRCRGKPEADRKVRILEQAGGSKARYCDFKHTDACDTDSDDCDFCAATTARRSANAATAAGPGGPGLRVRVGPGHRRRHEQKHRDGRAGQRHTWHAHRSHTCSRGARSSRFPCRWPGVEISSPAALRALNQNQVVAQRRRRRCPLFPR